MGRSRKSSALRAQKYYEMKDEARELKISVPEMKTIVEERERRKREEERRRGKDKKRNVWSTMSWTNTDDQLAL